MSFNNIPGRSTEDIGAPISPGSPTAGVSPLEVSTTEIFLGGVPRDATEADIRAVFNQYGTIQEVRLMMDKQTGTNKGFCFVNYTSREAVKKAVERGYVDIKGKRVRVTVSESRSRLFLGNIPKDMPRDALYGILSAQGEGLTKMELLTDPEDPTRNRGFVFLEYQSHQHAEKARRNLARPDFRLGNNPPSVSWADPRTEPDQETMSKVKVLYIRNLPVGATQDILQALFSPYGEIERVSFPEQQPGQKRRDYAFVHFKEREPAVAALQALNGYNLQGKEIEVQLAKPTDKKVRDEIKKKQLERSGIYRGGMPPGAIPYMPGQPLVYGFYPPIQGTPGGGVGMPGMMPIMQYPGAAGAYGAAVPYVYDFGLAPAPAVPPRPHSPPGHGTRGAPNQRYKPY